MTRFAKLLSVVALTAPFTVGCSSKDAGPPRSESAHVASPISTAPMTWPTTWSALYVGDVPIGDPEIDAQGSRNVIGNAANPAGFIAADANRMFFRLRLAASPLKNATTLDPFGWACVLDTDTEPKNYEFIANASGITDDVYFGLGDDRRLLDSPSTKSTIAVQRYTALQGGPVVNGTPGHVRALPAGTTLGGGTDYFIDWAIDLNDFPTTGAFAFDPLAQPFRVICGSSASATNISSDPVSASGATTLTGLKSDLIKCTATGCNTSSACRVDTDCTSAEFCNTGSFTCTPKLTNGTAIPTVTGHTPPLTGTCSSALVGTSVCIAGVCDAADHKCGYADGGGTCTATNAATVCRSATCVGGICVAPPACTTDAGCTTAQFCDTTPGAQKCVAKLTNGTAIPTISSHDPALTGMCTSAVGTSVCVAAVCDASDHKCGYATGSGPCTSTNASTVCRDGACSGSLKCMPVGGCLVDGDCPASSFCDNTIFTCLPDLSNGTSIPTIAGHDPALNGTCTAPAGSAVCLSLVCDTTDAKCGYANGNGTCSSSTATTVCRSDVCDPVDFKCGYDTGNGPCDALTAPTVCRTGACSVNGKCKPPAGCLVDGDCTSAQFCNTPSRTCTAKLVNSTPIPTVIGHDPLLDGNCTATSSFVCVSAVCDATDDLCGYPTGGPCTSQNAATVCRSGSCSVSLGCKPQGGCLVDGDCTSAQFCNTQSKACEAKLVNGTPIPTIAGHDPALTGTCTTAVGTAVCVSLVCDTSDHRCGSVNGSGTCDGTTAVVVCRSGVCDPDGKCGYDAGNGSCTSVTAATVCRSGLCSASGKCQAPNTCQVDADCTVATQFCNTQTKTCTSKLTNGTTIPTITGHDPALTGVCSAPVATAVCLAAVCDAIDHRCGLKNGDGVCSVATETLVCRSAVCGNDAKCGYPDGTGTCTSLTAATVCRSGSCSQSGVCKPANGCLVDPDCNADQFCTTTTRTCTAKLANGIAVPTIAGHAPVLNGVCTAPVGAAVCIADVCDTTDNLCGLANGSGTCTNATSTTVCRSGVCDAADSKCGFTVGGPCTVATAAVVCRSSLCSLAGQCIETGGCLVTGDCASPKVCDTTNKKCVECVTNAECSGTKPLCDVTPAVCKACNGDNGMTTTFTCTATNPYCVLAGATAGTCGKCATNADCGTGHAGDFCDPMTGACGTTCRVDADCTTTQFCNTGVCIAKLPNGDAIPASVGGQCTPAIGTRVCLAGVCNTADNKCGQPPGGTCTATGECRTHACVAGVCAQCTTDTDCGNATSAKVCNDTSKTCVDGCRGTGGNGCAAPLVCSSTTSTIGDCVAAPQVDAGPDVTVAIDTGVADTGAAQDTAPIPVVLDDGTVEGGGCGCSTPGTRRSSALEASLVALGLLVMSRRARRG